LTTFLRAKDKRGLTVPWAYTRSLIARAWHVPPWVVDEAPWDAVQDELRMRGIIGWADVAPELARRD
jgi:hypothetical protein